jgi:hypothetical protein
MITKTRLQTRKSVYLLLMLLCILSVLACDSTEKNIKPDKGSETSQATGIHKTVERGPITVRLDIDKKELTIADRLNLTLTALVDEDYDVTLPGFGEKLEQFGIVDYHTSQPELTENNRTRISRSYVLEPFLSGEYTIPAMKISFQKKNSPDSALHEIETEALTVNVTSLLPENFEKLTLHDIKPPRNLPRSTTLWVWAGGLLLFFLASGIAGFIIIRKRNLAGDQAMVQKISAHQQAFDELQALVSENLVEKGKIKEFYQKISDILRRYIENRFNLRAPEQTTEEFLSHIRTKNDFDDAHKTLLKNFLTHCDLVKFARHQPETEDIQKTFDSCKAFILGTQQED